jgi:NitT/TauT family transport system permease protein
MKKFISTKYFLYPVGILLFFLIWEIVSLIINEPIMIFPDPITTIIKAGELLTEEFTWKCIGGTLRRMLIGFGISLLIALFLGIIAGNNKKIQKIFEPTIVALKAVPTAAMVFVFLVLAGFDEAPIYIVVLIAFPILYEAVIGGFNNIPSEIDDALKLDDKNYFQKVAKVKLPLSIPYILVGIASSFALTFNVEIMAEIMTGSDTYGVGNAIQIERWEHSSDMRPVFAYSLIVIVMVLLTTWLSAFLKKKLISNK